MKTNMQNQTYRSRLENLNPKEDSSKPTILIVLSNICNKKKNSKQQCNCCITKISVEVYDM